MAVRSTMGTLITRVREMIGDEGIDGVTAFSDQRIQDVLDENCRRDVWYGQMQDQGTILPGGTVRYYDFYAPYQNWEGTVSLYNAEYTPLTGTLSPGTADYLRGYFNFAGSAQAPYGPVRPLYITGSFYELALGAAILLEMWAGSVKSHVSFKDPNYQFQMHEQYDHLRQLADYYRGMASPTTISMVRGDNTCL